MKVFISWSGELSKRIAELLKEWIPNVLQNADPWMSAADIEKGEIWFGAISDKLAEVSIGIICLTKENINAPWILFEAGSLSKGLTKNRVCTLLIESEPTDLKPPLSQFNATKPLKEDMAKLIGTINASDEKKMLPEQRIQASFERWWPEFEEKFSAAKQSLPPSVRPKRPVDDMTVEILETVRTVQKILQQKEVVRPPLVNYLSSLQQPVQTVDDARFNNLVFDLMPILGSKGITIRESLWGKPGNWITVRVDRLPDPETQSQMERTALTHGIELTVEQKT